MLPKLTLFYNCFHSVHILQERASKNNSFIYVKIPEVSLLVSYKVCFLVWFSEVHYFMRRNRVPSSNTKDVLACRLKVAISIPGLLIYSCLFELSLLILLGRDVSLLQVSSYSPALYYATIYNNFST